MVRTFCSEITVTVNVFGKTQVSSEIIIIIIRLLMLLSLGDVKFRVSCKRQTLDANLPFAESL